MTAETLIWTVILFGGTIVVVLWLVAIAWRHESAGEHDDGDGAEPSDSVFRE